MSFPSAFADWSHRATLTVPVVADDGILFGYLPMSKLPEEYWLNGDADGDDIRITEDDGETELPFYLPAAPNFSTDTGGIFIRLAGIASESVTADVTIYWGNIAASGYGPTDTYGRNAVFAGHAAAYLPGMTTNDLTSGGNNLTAVGSPGTTASHIEGLTAATYNASSAHHTASPISNWPATVSSIQYSTSAAAGQFVVALASTSSNQPVQGNWMRGDQTGDPFAAAARGTEAGAIVRVDSAGAYSANTWYHQHTTRDAASGTTRGYVDGSEFASGTPTLTGPPNWNKFGIGALYRSSIANGLEGRVVWAEVSASVRSADFISTMHNMWTDADWWTVGEAEENDSGPIEAGSTGWSPFQTAANVATGDVAWSNASHVLADDANAATCLLEDGETSQILSVVNPDFATPIPSGAVPNAVHFRLSRSGPTGSVEIRDILIRPVQALTLAGDNKQANGRWESLATATFGGDLWGLSWDTVDWTEAGFAIRVECTGPPASDGTASAFFAEIKVDWPGDDVTANTRGFFSLL
jgi:hypothetical protein